MCQPIGQTKLMTILNSYSAQTLPKTLLFVGDIGCGKKTFAKHLANRLQFDIVEIDSSAKSEDIYDFMYSTINTVYLINLDDFTEKQQNMWLKAVEEPTKSVYFILTATSEAGVLNTILNRCIKYNFEPYTKEQIEQITNASVNDQAFKIFQTPGKLLNLTDSSFNDIIDLADKLVKNINRASYANSLVISTKINYKDLYNKIDFNLFLDAVEYLAFEDYKNTASEQSFTIFRLTNQFKQHATKQNLIKEVLMLNYLTTLWEATHDINGA